jgi:hypothetical protein
VTLLAIMGGVGGILLLLTTVVVIGRAIFRQVTATEENTDSVKGLTTTMNEIKGMLQNHETRISVLEDRVKR